MALKGLDIFKLSPKKNCKECGCPTCMAFSMKVAQGAMDISACPHFAPEALEKLSEATAPPMKTIKCGAGDAERLHSEARLFFSDMRRRLSARPDMRFLCATAWMKRQLTQSWLRSRRWITSVLARECSWRWYTSTTQRTDLTTMWNWLKGCRPWQSPGSGMYRRGSGKGCTCCVQRQQADLKRRGCFQL